jgi:hypothetical protein
MKNLALICAFGLFAVSADAASVWVYECQFRSLSIIESPGTYVW